MSNGDSLDKIWESDLDLEAKIKSSFIIVGGVIRGYQKMENTVFRHKVYFGLMSLGSIGLVLKILGVI